MIKPTLRVLPKSIRFPEGVIEALSKAGYQCRQQGYGVFCWDPNGVWEHSKHGLVANGWLLRRFTSKGSRLLLAVTPRVTLANDQMGDLSVAEGGEISRRGFQKPNYSIAKRIHGCHRVIETLEDQGLSSASNSVPDVSENAHWLFGASGSKERLQGSLWNHLRRMGVSNSTQKKAIKICSEVFSQDTLGRLERLLESAFKSLGCNINTEAIGFEEGERLASQINEGSEPNGLVFLIGVTGTRGDPIPTRTSRLFDRLDMDRISYRAFADATLRNSYALNDQVPHLCELAGVSSYQVKLEEAFRDMIFLGFDLGHPKTLEHSVPVMSVVDNNGRLLGYWRGQQPRDETLRRKSLNEARMWLIEFANQRRLDPRHVIVMRDGRSFENDGLNEFMDQLPWAATLIELVKNPVPLLTDGDCQAKLGTLFELEENYDALLQTSTPLIRYDIGLPIRLRLVRNPNSLSIMQLAGAVYGLCHAPTLGLRSTRVPAPIYWSDGLAQESGKAIQFRGMNQVEHN